jgi:hypothetical protein
MITADQLLAHAIGDYIIQSDWMATEKTKKSLAAFIHVVTYTLPFLFITTSWPALAVICGTHFVIDRWRLARYVIWFRNLMMSPYHLGRSSSYPKWKECQKFGTPPTTPDWLAGWLHIFTDNILHVTINGLAIYYL